jgi:hypothetical protein
LSMVGECGSSSADCYLLAVERGSVVNGELSTVSCQWSTVNCQRLVVNGQRSAVSFNGRGFEYELSASECPIYLDLVIRSDNLGVYGHYPPTVDG